MSVIRSFLISPFLPSRVEAVFLFRKYTPLCRSLMSGGLLTLQLFLEILKDEKFQSAFIGIAGSLIGGAFTMLSVSWAQKKAEQSKKRDQLPERLSNLFEISVIASNMYTLFSNLATTVTSKM